MPFGLKFSNNYYADVVVIPYLYTGWVESGLSLKNSGKTHLSEKAHPTGNVSPTTAH